MHGDRPSQTGIKIFAADVAVVAASSSRLALAVFGVLSTYGGY